jgi:hypothetical protein
MRAGRSIFNAEKSLKEFTINIFNKKPTCFTRWPLVHSLGQPKGV